MIAEPGILSTSPWNSELLLKDLQSELFRPYLSISDAFDMGFSLMDTDNNDAWTLSARGDSCKFGVASSSSNPSSASSECSDELNFDVAWPSSSSPVNSAFPITDHDYVNTSLSLLDNNLEVCPSDCDFDWVAGEDLVVSTLNRPFNDDSSCEATSDAPPNAGKDRQSRKNDGAVASNKPWSKMSLPEQLEAVDTLTNIVSSELGLREQLDVIRIIEPRAVISPTDKEFVIDLNCMNDQKLSKVRDYVRRVRAAESSTEQNGRPGKGDKSKVTSAASTSCPSNRIERSSSVEINSPSKGKPSKKETKEKRPPQKVFKQRQKKEYKQLMKERRSGLFKREEVLSLKTAEIIEDDDIDILG